MHLTKVVDYLEIVGAACKDRVSLDQILINLELSNSEQMLSLINLQSQKIKLKIVYFQVLLQAKNNQSLKLERKRKLKLVLEVFKCPPRQQVLLGFNQLLLPIFQICLVNKRRKKKKLKVCFKNPPNLKFKVATTMISNKNFSNQSQ